MPLLITTIKKENLNQENLISYGRIKEIVVKGVEVYRSNDKGESWTKMSENNDFMERFCGTYGWVMGQIRVNPLDENCVVHFRSTYGKVK